MNKGFQEQVLSAALKENMNVLVYLTNGFQIRGVIKGFDSYVIIIENEGKQQMVYKHAISTIIPGRYVRGLSLRDDPGKESGGASGGHQDARDTRDMRDINEDSKNY